MGDEGPGSILAELKNLGLATGLSAGIDPENGYECSTGAAFFRVTITLTVQVSQSVGMEE